jgi:hypothetical protein
MLVILLPNHLRKSFPTGTTWRSRVDSGFVISEPVTRKSTFMKSPTVDWIFKTVCWNCLRWSSEQELPGKSLRAAFQIPTSPKVLWTRTDLYVGGYLSWHDSSKQFHHRSLPLKLGRSHSIWILGARRAHHVLHRGPELFERCESSVSASSSLSWLWLSLSPLSSSVMILCLQVFIH